MTVPVQRRYAFQASEQRTSFVRHGRCDDRFDQSGDAIVGRSRLELRARVCGPGKCAERGEDLLELIAGEAPVGEHCVAVELSER